MKTLTMSQQSIQTLSLWCIHYRKNAKVIVQHWAKDLYKAKPKKKLPLMYLANDILQNSRKKGPEFNKEFQHVMQEAVQHCVKTSDEKLSIALTRILGIWTERTVFNKQFIANLQAKLGGHQVEEGSTTPPLELMPAIDESGFTTTPNTAVGGGGGGVVVADAAAVVVAVAELKPPVNPPDPDDLVRRLQELEHSATQDALVREKIANLPTEVTDPTYIDKVQDLAAAKLLQDKINNACELLSEYNERLSAEQVDRELTQRMLVDYVAMQKYQQSKTEQKIEEYEVKLGKVKAVKNELKLHLENLPDLTKLPSPIPLPSAGDLFATRR